MGHLVRSMEIVRGLTQEFQVCFINGGEIINGFDIPAGVEVVNLPAIKTDAEFRALQVVDSDLDLAAVEAIRRAQLLQVYHQFQPDVLMIELFPFGRRKFSFELIPLLDAIQADDRKTKVVCSLRDIVVTKQNREKHEQKVCTLINQYFDLLLIHGDPKFQPIEETFSRIKDLQCPVYYTGYVVQPQPVESATLPIQEPIILATIGGGRFGHELLDAVVAAAPALETLIPHQIQVFTGPFYPEEKLQDLQWKATNCGNLRVDRYTPNLLQYMQRADLSISMSGYNTTLNVLTTGVKAMLMAFTGNDDQEQRMRSQKLAAMDLVTTIQPEDLAVDRFVALIQSCLQKPQQTVQFDFDGVAKTASLVRSMFEMQQVA
nr:glycosyltransferase [Alkalinema sp. FACHB-956]